jgi:hypothetical protein
MRPIPIASTVSEIAAFGRLEKLTLFSMALEAVLLLAK